MEKGVAQLQITGFFVVDLVRYHTLTHFLAVAAKDLRSKYDSYLVVSVLDSAGKTIGKPCTTSNSNSLGLHCLILLTIW